MPQNLFDSRALDGLVANSLKESPPAISSPAPPAENKGTSKWAILASILGDSADAFSTVQALKHPNIREANPLFGERPSAGKVIGLKAGAAALKALGEWGLGKMGHPTMGNILGYGSGAAMGGVAAQNMMQLEKAKNGK